MLFDEYRVEDAIALSRKEERELTLSESAKNLRAFGMTPEQIAHALKLPLKTVLRYLSK
jgi:DNA-binding CsgD family transcriptional regulator